MWPIRAAVRPRVAQGVSHAKRHLTFFVLSAFLGLLIAASESHARVVRLDTPVRLNDNTDGSHYGPRLLPLADGGFFAVWISRYTLDDPLILQARAFDAAGAPLGSQFQLLGAVDQHAVASDGSRIAYLTSDSIVTIDPLGVVQSTVPFAPARIRSSNMVFGAAGSLAVTWDSVDPTAVQLQVLQANGESSDVHALVTDGPFGSFPRDPTVTALADDRFFISWWAEDEGTILGVGATKDGPSGQVTSLVPSDAPPATIPPNLCSLGSVPVVAWVSSGLPIQLQYLSESGQPISTPACTNVFGQGGGQPALACIDSQQAAVAGVTESVIDGAHVPSLAFRALRGSVPTGHAIVPVQNPGYFPPATLPTGAGIIQLAWADCDATEESCDLYRQALMADGVPECPGDCDDDGHVTIAELLMGVNVLLGDLPYASCPSLFVDTSTCNASVAEIVRAVSAALRGCP